MCSRVQRAAGPSLLVLSAQPDQASAHAGVSRTHRRLYVCSPSRVRLGSPAQRPNIDQTLEMIEAWRTFLRTGQRVNIAAAEPPKKGEHCAKWTMLVTRTPVTVRREETKEEGEGLWQGGSTCRRRRGSRGGGNGRLEPVRRRRGRRTGGVRRQQQDRVARGCGRADLGPRSTCFCTLGLAANAQGGERRTAAGCGRPRFRCVRLRAAGRSACAHDGAGLASAFQGPAEDEVCSAAASLSLSLSLSLAFVIP